MEPDFLSPPKTLQLPLASEEAFDFFSTWRRVASATSLEHLGPIPHPSPSHHGLPALLELHDGDKVEPIVTHEQWKMKRRHLKENLTWLLGEQPAPPKAVGAKVIFETACAGYVRRKIRLQVDREISSQIVFQSSNNGQTRRRVLMTVESESLPAYLCIPTSMRTARPAVICLHQFNTEAASRESVGLDPEHNDMAFADELAREGFVTLAFDLPGCGERRHEGAGHAEKILEYYRAQPRSSLLGRMAWEVSRAVDYLSTLEGVDSQRIGCMGHLLGGIVALFAAALDPRLRAVVASAACATFRSQIERGTAYPLWCAETAMLPLLGFFDEENMGDLPMEYHECVALIAPRPLFLCTPMRSDYFPREGLEEVARHLENLYAFLDSPERLSVNYPHYFIFFPEELREAAYHWLTRFL